MVDLYPHQLEAIDKIHNGSILRGSVGTGKSRTAIGWAYLKCMGGQIDINSFGTLAAPATPKDIIIITTAKKRDSLEWEEEALDWRISTIPELSIGGCKITVDSWNNIEKYTGLSGSVFIFDEQRLVGSGAWVKSFLAIAKANEWILLSATPGDTWLDYVPVFLANGYYRTRTEFLKRHVVYSRYSKFPKVDHYVEEGYLLKLRARVLVEMPYKSHTKRHVSNTMVQYDADLFKRVWQDRWNIYTEEPVKDIAELFRVARKLVNGDVSRIAAIMELIEKHPKLIIFYNFDYELEALRCLRTTLNYEVKEWNGHKHENIPEGDKWLYLVQYTAGAEGWNCITTDAIAFYSLNYSWKINEQAKGRIDRLNTPFTDLWYYVLCSASPIDTAIAKSIATKHNFNERIFVEKLDLAA